MSHYRELTEWCTRTCDRIGRGRQGRITNKRHGPPGPSGRLVPISHMDYPTRDAPVLAWATNDGQRVLSELSVMCPPYVEYGHRRVPDLARTLSATPHGQNVPMANTHTGGTTGVGHHRRIGGRCARS